MKFRPTTHLEKLLL